MSTKAVKRQRGAEQSREQLGKSAKLKEPPLGTERITDVGMLIKIGLVLSLFLPVSLFMLYTYLVPARSYPVLYSLPNPPKLKLNNYLASAEILFEGQIEGPEATIHHDGVLYTGTADGRIVRVMDGQVKKIARIGKLPCGGYDNEPTCGRPLGMRFDANGYLVVCDAYYGLYKINVTTGDTHVLLPSSVLINGRTINFLNDLDIASDGIIYMSDSSVYQRRDYMLDLLDGRPTGRLLKYDPVHNTTEVLVDGLNMANGVQLSRNEDFVLVADLLMARIIKYNLKGINAGHFEIFADNLPCFPDNIRASSSGGFWIGAAVPRFEGNFLNGLDFLAPRPWLRKLLSWLPYDQFLAMSPSGSILVELNANGDIVRTLMDRDGTKVRMSTDVNDQEGVLYIGSFSESYIARYNSSPTL